MKIPEFNFTLSNKQDNPVVRYSLKNSPMKVPEKLGGKLQRLTFHFYALDKNDKLYVLSLHQIVWDSDEEILRLQLKLKGFKIN